MDATGAGVGIVGLVLGLILFVIGIVWLIFPFIVNSWLKKIHAEMEQANQETRNLLQETSRTNQLLTQSLTASRSPAPAPAHVVTRKTAPVPIPIPEPIAQSQTVHISKDGKDIGEHPIINVKQMLRNRQLTTQDMFFDTKTEEWTTLDLHPALH